MKSEYFRNKELETVYLQTLNSLNNCKVSRASTELMLERFCNGQEIDFPFT